MKDPTRRRLNNNFRRIMTNRRRTSIRSWWRWLVHLVDRIEDEEIQFLRISVEETIRTAEFMVRHCSSASDNMIWNEIIEAAWNDIQDRFEEGNHDEREISDVSFNIISPELHDWQLREVSFVSGLGKQSVQSIDESSKLSERGIGTLEYFRES
jgi:hypothetical protein